MIFAEVVGPVLIVLFVGFYFANANARRREREQLQRIRDAWKRVADGIEGLKLRDDGDIEGVLEGLPVTVDCKTGWTHGYDAMLGVRVQCEADLPTFAAVRTGMDSPMKRLPKIKLGMEDFDANMDLRGADVERVRNVVQPVAQALLAIPGGGLFVPENTQPPNLVVLFSDLDVASVRDAGAIAARIVAACHGKIAR